MDELPDELMIKILSFMEPNDLINCSRISKQWNELSNDLQLWKNLQHTTSVADSMILNQIDFFLQQLELRLFKIRSFIEYGKRCNISFG